MEQVLLAVRQIGSEAEGSGTLVVEVGHVRVEVLRIDESFGARIQHPLCFLAVRLDHLVSEHVCLLITEGLAAD